MNCKTLRRPWLFALAGLLLGSGSAFPADTGSFRERISMNTGWRFTKNDPADLGDQLNYEKIKEWILPMGADLTKLGG